MKNAKIIIGLALAVFATISFVDVSKGESGAGLLGMVTFYVFMLTISAGLIYSGTKKPKETLQKEKAKRDGGNQKTEETKDFEDKIHKLISLKNKGLLTKEEYESKIKMLEESKLNLKTQKSDDYKHLKELLEEGFLTKTEFEEKVNILKERLRDKPKRKKERLGKEFTIFLDNDLNYGFKNQNGDVVIKPRYDFVENFSDGLAVVTINRKFGFIDKNGRVVINIGYDNAYSFRNGKALVEISDLEYYIDKKGNKIN